MHREKVRQRAIALYESGLSCRAVARAIAGEFGASATPQTVARWVRKTGRSRPVGDRRRVELPRQAARLYEAGLTQGEIAKRFAVSPATVQSRLRELGVRARPSGLRYARLADKGWLENQYVERGRSAMAIARRVGCNVLTVHYHLRRHGIPRKRSRRIRA